jgi:threonine dehydrogenase-like Zn-dependent dehydrogenase
VKTVVLEAPGRMTMADRSDPGAPGPGEARVRVLRVGVCGTDLHAYRGRQAFIRYPVVPGHELAVEVEVLGPGTEVASVRPGDRCVLTPYLFDGTCQACRAGRTNCCTTLTLLGVHVDGGMCDTMVVPASLLLPANDLPVDTLALAEMLAVGAHAAARARLDEGARVLVIGAGPIGLSVLAFVRLKAAATYVVDVDERRLALAEGAGLAVALRLPTAEDAGVEERVAELRSHLGGDLPEVVIDATGSRASMERAPALAAPGGRLVLVGHTPGPLTFANPVLHGKELELVFSRNARRQDFDAVFAALRGGRVDPGPWISTRVDPEGFVRSVEGWTMPGADLVKAVVEWPQVAAGGGPATGVRDGQGRA